MFHFILTSFKLIGVFFQHFHLSLFFEYLCRWQCNSKQSSYYLYHLYPAQKWNTTVMSEPGLQNIFSSSLTVAKKLIGDSKVSISISALDHRRNVGCVSLFYRYFKRFCSRKIKALVPKTRKFLRITRYSKRAHPFVVDMVCVYIL